MNKLALVFYLGLTSMLSPHGFNIQHKKPTAQFNKWELRKDLHSGLEDDMLGFVGESTDDRGHRNTYNLRQEMTERISDDKSEFLSRHIFTSTVSREKLSTPKNELIFPTITSKTDTLATRTTRKDEHIASKFEELFAYLSEWEALPQDISTRLPEVSLTSATSSSVKSLSTVFSQTPRTSHEPIIKVFSSKGTSSTEFLKSSMSEVIIKRPTPHVNISSNVNGWNSKHHQAMVIPSFNIWSSAKVSGSFTRGLSAAEGHWDMSKSRDNLEEQTSRVFHVKTEQAEKPFSDHSEPSRYATTSGAPTAKTSKSSLGIPQNTSSYLFGADISASASYVLFGRQLSPKADNANGLITASYGIKFKSSSAERIGFLIPPVSSTSTSTTHFSPPARTKDIFGGTQLVVNSKRQLLSSVSSFPRASNNSSLSLDSHVSVPMVSSVYVTQSQSMTSWGASVTYSPTSLLPSLPSSTSPPSYSSALPTPSLNMRSTVHEERSVAGISSASKGNGAAKTLILVSLLTLLSPLSISATSVPLSSSASSSWSLSSSSARPILLSPSSSTVSPKLASLTVDSQQSSFGESPFTSALPSLSLSPLSSSSLALSSLTASATPSSASAAASTTAPPLASTESSRSSASTTQSSSAAESTTAPPLAFTASSQSSLSSSALTTPSSSSSAAAASTTTEPPLASSASLSLSEAVSTTLPTASTSSQLSASASASTPSSSSSIVVAATAPPSASASTLSSSLSAAAALSTALPSASSSLLSSSSTLSPISPRTSQMSLSSTLPKATASSDSLKSSSDVSSSKRTLHRSSSVSSAPVQSVKSAIESAKSSESLHIGSINHITSVIAGTMAHSDSWTRETLWTVSCLQPSISWKTETSHMPTTSLRVSPSVTRKSEALSSVLLNLEPSLSVKLQLQSLTTSFYLQTRVKWKQETSASKILQSSMSPIIDDMVSSNTELSLSTALDSWVEQKTRDTAASSITNHLGAFVSQTKDDLFSKTMPSRSSAYERKGELVTSGTDIKPSQTVLFAASNTASSPTTSLFPELQTHSTSLEPLTRTSLLGRTFSSKVGSLSVTTELLQSTLIQELNSTRSLKVEKQVCTSYGSGRVTRAVDTSDSSKVLATSKSASGIDAKRTTLLDAHMGGRKTNSAQTGATLASSEHELSTTDIRPSLPLGPATFTASPQAFTTSTNQFMEIQSSSTYILPGQMVSSGGTYQETASLSDYQDNTLTKEPGIPIIPVIRTAVVQDTSVSTNHVQNVGSSSSSPIMTSSIIVSSPSLVNSKVIHQEPSRVSSAVGMDSSLIVPSPSRTVFPSSSANTDGNLSVITDPKTITPADLSTAGSDSIFLLITVATVPAVLIILIVIVLFIVYKRRTGKKSREPIYSIKVEYPDENKTQMRPRWRNSRLDLTINGIHIDLEFPNSADKRHSARISGVPNLTEAQMKELQILSKECKENLEWINEVLEREIETPLCPAVASTSEGDRLLCAKQRDSLYSGCSEKEKENYEVSEKLIRRDSSPKRAAGYVPKVIRRWQNLERESPRREPPDGESTWKPGESQCVPKEFTYKGMANNENDSPSVKDSGIMSYRKEIDDLEVELPFPCLVKESYDPLVFIEDGLEMTEQKTKEINEIKTAETPLDETLDAPEKRGKQKRKKSVSKDKKPTKKKGVKETASSKPPLLKTPVFELPTTHAPNNELDKDVLGVPYRGRRELDTRNLPCPTLRKGPKMRFETL